MINYFLKIINFQEQNMKNFFKSGVTAPSFEKNIVEQESKDNF